MPGTLVSSGEGLWVVEAFLGEEGEKKGKGSLLAKDKHDHLWFRTWRLALDRCPLTTPGPRGAAAPGKRLQATDQGGRPQA